MCSPVSDAFPSQDGTETLTAHLMPERLRASFGLAFGEEERRSALRALRLIRRVYPVLPTPLRYVAPYHEALGRLCGRSRPNLMTRSLQPPMDRPQIYGQATGTV